VTPPATLHPSDLATGLTARIRQHLSVLTPEAVDISDDSADHAGHPGAASGGGHFHLTIISRNFAGKNRIERHRMVYAALKPLMLHEIHALAIIAHSPDEL